MSYHSHFKTENSSALNPRCFQDKQQGLFFSLSIKIPSSLHPPFTWTVLLRMLFFLACLLAFQCFDVCVCVHLVCEARTILYLGTQQQIYIPWVTSSNRHANTLIKILKIYYHFITSLRHINTAGLTNICNAAPACSRHNNLPQAAAGECVRACTVGTDQSKTLSICNKKCVCMYMEMCSV